MLCTLVFGMTAITTGGDKGWRLALRHALGDVAQNQLFSPRQTLAKVKSTEQDNWQGTYSLFDFD